MSFMKCFDTVEMSVGAVVEKYAGMYVEDADKKNALKCCCEDIDAVIDRFGCCGFDVEVDEGTADVSVSISADYIEVYKKTDAFYDIADFSKKIVISNVDDEKFKVTFVFCGYLDKVGES